MTIIEQVVQQQEENPAPKDGFISVTYKNKKKGDKDGSPRVTRAHNKKG